MGAAASIQAQEPDAHIRYREIIRQIVSKGGESTKMSVLHRYTGDVLHKSKSLRPIRTPKDVAYATRPTLLGRKGPSHLIGTISEKTLQTIPTAPLTDEESRKIASAYRLLIHVLNVCAVVLGSETPSPQEEQQNRALLHTLSTLYNKGPTQGTTGPKPATGDSLRRKMIDEITSNATTAVTILEDEIQRRRGYNAFMVFSDNRVVIRKLGEYITPRRSTLERGIQSGKPQDSLSLFKLVLHHVNTLTICGDGRNQTLLRHLSKSGGYPDILMVIVSDMASLLESEKHVSSVMSTMIRWARMRLRSAIAYGSKEDEIVEGATMRQLFMKQGDALHKATETACSVFTKQFGQVTFQPEPNGVVVHTSDKGEGVTRGTPVKTPSRPNAGAKRLYSQVQRENRAVAAVAAKTFESLFTVTIPPTPPPPGTINIPVDMNIKDTSSVSSPGVKTQKVYVTLHPEIVNSADPVATLSNAAAVLAYTIAVAYDNLWTILSKENMKEVYGLK